MIIVLLAIVIVAMGGGIGGILLVASLPFIIPIGLAIFIPMLAFELLNEYGSTIIPLAIKALLLVLALRWVWTHPKQVVKARCWHPYGP